MAIFIPDTAGATDKELEAVERRLGCRLPATFETFLRRHNGASPEPNRLPGAEQGITVRYFLPLSAALALAAEIEGFPRDAWPVAEAACGNYIWLDARSGAIFYWDHEIDGKSPSIAQSFDEFLEKLEPWDPATVRLEPGQVRSVWIDPAFLEALKSREN